MQIEINGKRNITLDFNAPKKFRLVKDGAEIPYIRTGKNSFRLSKPVDDFVELEEIVEQPRYMQPVQLQPQQMTVINPQDVDRLNEAVRQMALVNPQDVMIINQTAEQLKQNQNFIAQTQKEITNNQVYIDQQQQRINETALGIQALETDNSQRLDGAENAILNLAGEISNTQNMAVDGMNTALNKIEEQGILLQTEIDTKADKDELESLKKDFEEKSDQFSNAMSNYSGGTAYDTLPQGGEAGQILAKRTDRQGDYIWINQTPVIVKSETIPTASEKYKGEVYQYVGETGDYTHGYIYECQQNGTSYNWVRIDVQPNTAVWGQITGTLSDQTDLQNALDDKQATLVSGTNIKTINNVSLLGSGNIMAGVGYGISTTEATEAQKEVSISSITALNVGQIIVVKPTVTASGANSTLKLNDFPAYPIRYNDAAITTSTNSIVWSARFPSQFIFDGDYWVFLGHGVDSNTTYTINYSLDAGKYTAGIGAYAVNRYSLIAQKADGTWERLTDTTKAYSIAATKTVNTRGFILNQLRYYGGTSAYGDGAKIATNVLYQKAASVNTAYSFNCSTAPGWAVGDYIYLVGTLGVDGLFYLDTTAWWSNALPSTNDGKLYIRLGLALTSTDATMSFFSDRPIFYHDGVKICEYKVADNKQDTLVSGANIKTVNGNSLLGSGNVNIDSLPSQTGQSGKYLTTNGTNASWAQVDITPDNLSITKDSNNHLQTVGVIDSNNTTNAIKLWTGTKAQRDAIVTKDPYTLYNVTDDTSSVDIMQTILSSVYPVGSVYITTANTCPLSALISGSTWVLVSSGRVLQGADSGHSAGTTIDAGLPNITGSVRRGNSTTGIYVSGNGAFSVSDAGSTYIALGSSSQNDVYKTFSIDASASNPIYGNSTTVQPPAYVVNIYRRTN